MVRARRVAREKTRERLATFEALLQVEGTEEQRRAYGDLVRDLPGFRGDHGRALSRALGDE